MVPLSTLKMSIKKINRNEIIVYTSGYGGLFKPGLPVGKIITNDLNKDNEVSFFSDFRQLDYVKIVFLWNWKWN